MTITVRSRDGLELEAAVDEPDTPPAGVVLCHPHPRLGGTMDAPLLLALRDELYGRGWTVLRFNFRGVGASQGESATGVAEVADAAGAADVLKGRLGGSPFALVGWSFGAAIAARTAALEGPAACVAIAPAVTAKQGISAGLPDAAELGIRCPLLVVVGSNDEQIAPDEVEAWVAGVPQARFVKVPGANHFFWAKYEQLTALVADWLDEVV